MTTEAPPKTREERLFDHLKDQIAEAREKGGCFQFLIDFKMSEGRLVGEAVVDVKHRLDLQAR